MPTAAPPFADDAPIRYVGLGLLARSLPKAEWTHQAHLLATLYLMQERPDLELRRDLPGIIWRYNQASGTTNTDSAGYHETITQFYLLALANFRARLPAELPLHRQAGLLLSSAFAAHDLPLEHWRRETLFSVEARRVWVAPDKAPLDFARLTIAATPTA